MNEPDKSRGARANLPHRFARTTVEAVEDGWWQDDDAPPARATRLHVDAARRSSAGRICSVCRAAPYNRISTFDPRPWNPAWSAPIISTMDTFFDA